MRQDNKVSLKEATKLGLKFYYSNTPCLRGHMTKKYTKNNHCVECSALTHKIWSKNNRKKQYAIRKRWADNNPDGVKNASLKHFFNITIDEYKSLLAQQDHRCAICHQHINNLKRDLAVDHNHENSKIRGLLCDNCNWGLGQFKDDIGILKEAIKYLKKSK